MGITWLESFSRSIARHAGEAVREEVLRGSENLGSRPTPSRRARWVRGAMDRLEALVDEETLRQIMIDACPHTYPRKRIERMRRLYGQSGSIDELLEAMYGDTSYGGTSYYDSPRGEGDTVYINKVPCNPKSYEKAENELDRKLAYCHCPWVRAALRTCEAVPPSFCHCSTSWDRQLWEGVLGRPVDVEVVKSLLKGDEHCIHAFRLP